MTSAVHQFPSAFESTRQVRVRFDAAHKVLWHHMDLDGRPCFTESFLEEGLRCYRNVEEYGRMQLAKTGSCPIHYTVLASAHPTVYNYGGDIFLFAKLIRERDRERLRRYTRLCVEIVYIQSVNYHLPMTTLSLVQGEALGGGFEGALCCSVMVAEQRARFGFPEILFNLFPGMGAYHFLARRVGMKRAEEIMTSGNVYTAAQMHQMGVVDVLAEDGAGEKAVYDFLRTHSKRLRARQGIDRVRQDIFRITKESLERTADLWVETALALDDIDLRMMERLVRAQIAKENGDNRRDAGDTGRP